MLAYFIKTVFPVYRSLVGFFHLLWGSSVILQCCNAINLYWWNFVTHIIVSIQCRRKSQISSSQHIYSAKCVIGWTKHEEKALKVGPQRILKPDRNRHKALLCQRLESCFTPSPEQIPDSSCSHPGASQKMHFCPARFCFFQAMSFIRQLFNRESKSLLE